MIRLLAPKPGNRVLNVMCGSGTLIAEALNYNQHLICTGVDSDNKAIEKCVENLQYFKDKFKSQIELVISDCKNLHFEDSKYDLVVSDLPWGEAISKKSDLKKTYKDTFKEISRVAKPNAKLGIITQRDELVKAELPLALSSWKLIDEFKVFQGGFTPSVFIFTR